MSCCSFSLVRYNNPVLIDKHQPDKKDVGGPGKGGGKGGPGKKSGEKDDGKEDGSESGKGTSAKDRSVTLEVWSQQVFRAIVLWVHPQKNCPANTSPTSQNAL